VREIKFPPRRAVTFIILSLSSKGPGWAASAIAGLPGRVIDLVILPVILPPAPAYTFLRPRRGVLPVKETIEERACKLAQYIIEHNATVRAAAKEFGVSKSTVHIEVII
jgi:putative DeoR family transcriptional regulator (stage III sporulation protein D)